MTAEERTGYIEAEESIDIRAFLFKCFRYWYVFLAMLFLAMSLAVLFNRFSTPHYKVSAYILIKDEENPLDPEKFIGSSLYGNPYTLQNEIGLLRSKSLTARAVNKLNLVVSYFSDEHFRHPELYTSAPFSVDLDTTFDQPLNVDFHVNFLNDTLMVIAGEATEVVLHNFSSAGNKGIIPAFSFSDTVGFGEVCGNQYCRFRVLPNFPAMTVLQEQRRYVFHFNSLAQLVTMFRITEVEEEKNSSILKVSLRCSNVQEGADYLNELTRVFLAKGIERKDRIAASTLDFIDSQLRGITDSLRYSEDRLQQFRSLQGVTNIDFQAQQTYQQMEGLQDQKAELMVKSKYYSYLREYLGKNNRVDDLIAPTSMDINDPLLNNLILELTRLYAERSEMSFNSVKNNPYLNSLEMKISDIKAKLIENIDNIIKTGEISLREIDARISTIETQINRLPRSQRELLVIERKFKLNDAIYTYLLTKRSEIQISKASNLPSNEMLDPASADDYIQVSPNTRMNYIIALLLGLFLPAAMIYLKDFFRSSISGKQDIQTLTDAPIIGHIIHNAHQSKQVVFDFPTSLVAESFRSLRTNFQFFQQTDDRFTILITSMIKGEGKSFTSVNLGTVFAQHNKKVVVVDFDLRKARLHHYLDIQTNNGLSRYLSNNAGFDEIVFACGVPNFDVIPSGPTPPNPSELISSEKTADLFRELHSRYDIVLIDSPPVGLVSDALQLIRHANVTLVVVRQHYTPKDLFASVMSDLSNREIGSLNIVINDEKPGTDRYGYGYGYGYGQEKETLADRIRKVLKGKPWN